MKPTLKSLFYFYKMNIELARIYENKKSSTAIMILVDRLWPRGIAKESANLDFWFKDWAPSKELRKEFHQNHIDWEEFRQRYQGELSDNKKNILDDLEAIDKRKKILLLYGSKDKDRNHAVLLKDFLKNL